MKNKKKVLVEFNTEQRYTDLTDKAILDEVVKMLERQHRGLEDYTTKSSTTSHWGIRNFIKTQRHLRWRRNVGR